MILIYGHESGGFLVSLYHSIETKCELERMANNLPIMETV
jgi:hypothetical protein